MLCAMRLELLGALTPREAAFNQQRLVEQERAASSGGASRGAHRLE